MADEKDDEELCYQTPSRWKLPQRNRVLKAAKSIIAYTLNVLSENDKGPITSSEKNDVIQISMTHFSGGIVNAQVFHDIGLTGLQL